MPEQDVDSAAAVVDATPRSVNTSDLYVTDPDLTSIHSRADLFRRIEGLLDEAPDDHSRDPLIAEELIRRGETDKLRTLLPRLRNLGIKHAVDILCSSGMHEWFFEDHILVAFGGRSAICTTELASAIIHKDPSYALTLLLDSEYFPDSSFGLDVAVALLRLRGADFGEDVTGISHKPGEPDEQSSIHPPSYIHKFSQDPLGPGWMFEYVKAGLLPAVIRNLAYFHDIPDHDKIAKVAIENGYHKDLTDNINAFSGLSTDTAERLIKAGYVQHVLLHTPKFINDDGSPWTPNKTTFGWVKDGGFLEKLFYAQKDPPYHHILSFFRGLDRDEIIVLASKGQMDKIDVGDMGAFTEGMFVAQLADDLIERGYEYQVVQSMKIFKGRDNEIARSLIEKNKAPVLLRRLYNFKDLDSQIAHQLLDTCDTDDLQTLLTNIKCFNPDGLWTVPFVLKIIGISIPLFHKYFYVVPQDVAKDQALRQYLTDKELESLGITV